MQPQLPPQLKPLLNKQAESLLIDKMAAMDPRPADIMSQAIDEMRTAFLIELFKAPTEGEARILVNGWSAAMDVMGEGPVSISQAVQVLGTKELSASSLSLLQSIGWHN